MGNFNASEWLRCGLVSLGMEAEPAAVSNEELELFDPFSQS
jgi:hypothetical protein